MISEPPELPFMSVKVLAEVGGGEKGVLRTTCEEVKLATFEVCPAPGPEIILTTSPTRRSSVVAGGIAPVEVKVVPL